VLAVTEAVERQSAARQFTAVAVDGVEPETLPSS
jgi:hypothetical protein